MEKGCFKKLAAICILGLLLMTGCSREKKITTETKFSSVDWRQGFTVGEVTEVQEWNICDYQVQEEKKNGEGQLIRGVSLRQGNQDYRGLNVYQTAEGNHYYLEIVSMDGGSTELIPIDKNEWEQIDEMFLYFDAVADRLYLGTDDVSGQVCIVIMDTAGSYIDTVDVKVGLSALGCKELPDWMYVDGEGYFYFIGGTDASTIYVLDNKGKGVLSYQCNAMEGEYIFNPVRDNQGRIFFPVYKENDGDTVLLWRNAKNSFQELAKIEDSIVINWYAMRDNLLFYGESDYLIRWNVLTGERECILNFSENGIPEYTQCMLRVDERGQVYIRNCASSDNWFARVTWEEPVYDNPITMGITVEGYTVSFLKGALATYGRENNCPIQVKGMEGHSHDGEEQVNHMLVDAVNGKGADIMYVSYQDMLHLQREGAILEMDELLPKDIEEKLLPNVLTFGMIEEKLYGMPVGMNLHTMFVNREIYSDSGWTIDDVLRLNNEDSGLQCIFTLDAENATGSDVLHDMVVYDLVQEKSRFIDWENRISRFEANDFEKVLEAIKETGFTTEYHGSESVELGRDRIVTGEALGFPCTACDPVFFNYLMNEFGDTCYPIGFPTDEGKGSYLTSDGVLVVNSKISEEKKEMLREMLAYLYSKECQKGLHSSLSVLKGMIEECAVYKEHMDKFYWNDGTSSHIVLWESKDGSAYMNAYAELLENAEIYKENTLLSQIVMEECTLFFAGDSTALEVTRKIDNRVQLYLDENS